MTEAPPFCPQAKLVKNLLIPRHNNCSKQLQHDQRNSSNTRNARTGGTHSFSLSPCHRAPLLHDLKATHATNKRNNLTKKAAEQ